MIRRHVLAALTLGVAAGDEEVARAELARIDWILRGRARRRLEAALIDATLASGPATDDPAEIRHRLRAAALIVQRRTDCDLGDRGAVAAAYAELVAPPPARTPIVTVVAALTALVLMTALGTAAVRIVTTHPETSFTRPPPPPPVGVFRDGGVPLRDPAIEQVLASALPALVAHKVTDEAGRRREVAALREPLAIAAHGPRLAAAWREMIEAIDAWMDLDSTDASYRTASEELRARIEVVSDQLAAVELGYYLDPEILAEHSRRRAGIYAYRIEQVAFVSANAKRVRVLDVRRLDHLGDDLAVLGMTTEELHDSIVVLDQIDAKVRTQLLPVLAGAPYWLGDDVWARTRGRGIAVAAGDAIRRELRVVLGDTPNVEARVRELVTESVRHHEAQHGYDHDRDLPMPAALAPYVGAATTTFAIRARYELSGYLAQIASDLWLPQLTLWNLSRHAFRRSATSRLEEQFVGVVVIEGLARRLGIPSPGPVIHDGNIDRDRLAALVLPLTERSTIELRAAAAKLWAESFGERLVRITDE